MKTFFIAIADIFLALLNLFFKITNSFFNLLLKDYNNVNNNYNNDFNDNDNDNYKDKNKNDNGFNNNFSNIFSKIKNILFPVTEEDETFIFKQLQINSNSNDDMDNKRMDIGIKSIVQQAIGLILI